MKVKSSPSIAAICSAALIFNFSSCKYEDGPKLSLRTKTARLTGEWDLKKLDGDNFKDGEIIFEFEKDGDFTLSGEFSYYYYYTYEFSEKGEWEWADGKEAVEIEIDGDKTEYEILRLTNDELIMEYDNTEMEFEKI